MKRQRRPLKTLVWLVCYRDNRLPGSATITISKEDDDVDDYQEQEIMVDQNIVHDAESKDVEFGTTQLSDAKRIDSALAEKLKSSHAACYKKTSDGGLPVHEQVNKTMLGKKPRKTKHTPFVEIMHDKKVFIHKSTAVWALQEGERVSSDSLFRVKAKQPFSIENQHKTETKSLKHSSVCPTIGIGCI